MTVPGPGARLLVALETSGAVGSVAVARNGDVLARGFLTDARSHAGGILGALDRALAEAGVGRRELEGVAVGAGPGSFTGVRIAAATAKGLAHALGVPLFAVSSLRAAAISDFALPPGAGPAEAWVGRDPPRAGPRWVLFDARGGRVYAACYRVSEGRVEPIHGPRATHVDALLEGRSPDGVVFAGEGAGVNRAVVEAAGFTVLEPPAGVATADAVIRLVCLGGVHPVDDPAGWEPEYLKRSNAERERGP